MDTWQISKLNNYINSTFISAFKIVESSIDCKYKYKFQDVCLLFVNFLNIHFCCCIKVQLRYISYYIMLVWSSLAKSWIRVQRVWIWPKTIYILPSWNITDCRLKIPVSRSHNFSLASSIGLGWWPFLTINIFIVLTIH